MLTFKVTYQIEASSASHADDWAKSVAREQTIECIDEGVPHAFILDEVLGKVIHLIDQDDGFFHATIAYNADTVAGDLPQLFNVIYGNTSMHVGVRMIGIEMPAQMQAQFPGPRYGAQGIRDAVGNQTGPMVCSVLKPMGLTPDELAQRAFQCVLGGADMIKDDHNFANQRWAPFKQRVEAVAAAVAKANSETGNSTLYAPSMNCPIDKFEHNARFAKQAGATAYLVMPGLTSYDSVRLLASSDELSMPIMLHPSTLGSYSNAGTNGISHAALYATYARIAGADITIYPSFGGRYGFSKEMCLDVANACRADNGLFKPILPSPGGGMKLELAPMLSQMYGNDAMFLFGGGAMRYQDRIAEGIRELKAALGPT